MPQTGSWHTVWKAKVSLTGHVACLCQSYDAGFNTFVTLLLNTVTSPVAVELLPPSCNNHTLSIYTAQLQSRYETLVKQKDQLDASYSSLRNMRDQIRTEKEKLQSKLSSIGQWFVFVCLFTDRTHLHLSEMKHIQIFVAIHEEKHSLVNFTTNLNEIKVC